MSKKKKQKKNIKKVKETKSSTAKVVSTKKEQTLEPTKSRSRAAASAVQAQVPLLYGRKNFMFILIGIACMGLGMLLMAGGGMPSPDIWDESIIYGFRRVTLAPIMILLGLGFVLYSIFLPAGENA